MKAVKKKMKSRCGIALAIALVFVLLCDMVGTVVLTAASTSAGNTARERQLYRETQALISAAQLLNQDVQAMSYTGSHSRSEIVTTTVTSGAVGEEGQPSGSSSVTTEYQYNLSEPKLEGSKLFSVQGQEDDLGLTQRYMAKHPDEFENSIITLSSVELKFAGEETFPLPEVTGKITVEEDYGLAVELVCGENCMSLHFPAQCSTKTDVGEPQKTDGGSSYTQKITTSTYSTVIRWGQALMEEGGAGYGQTTP